jgi:putative SOS response-associated peptidase YedK
VITTAANDVVRPINDRMPVVIAKEDYALWLDPEFFDLDELERMMTPFPAKKILAVPARWPGSQVRRRL